MAKKLELKLNIKIEEINVIDNEFFEIHYKYTFDGKNWESDMIDGDYENGMSAKEWKKELENGVAMEQVFQKIAEDYQD